MLALVDQVPDFVDLTSLEVRDVNHVDDDAPVVDLLEDVIDDSLPVEVHHGSREQRCILKLLLRFSPDQLALILELVASVADHLPIWLLKLIVLGLQKLSRLGLVQNHTLWTIIDLVKPDECL